MNGDQVELVQPVRLVSVDPARNRARFYVLSVQTTLWGEPAVVCTWGRIGGLGRVTVRILESAQAANATLIKTVDRRLKRGYTVMP